MKYTVIAVMAVLMLCGCTTRAWYDGMRAGQSHNCSKLDGDAKQKCINDSNMSYDQYNRAVNAK